MQLSKDLLTSIDFLELNYPWNSARGGSLPPASACYAASTMPGLCTNSYAGPSCAASHACSGTPPCRLCTTSLCQPAASLLALLSRPPAAPAKALASQCRAASQAALLASYASPCTAIMPPAMQPSAPPAMCQPHAPPAMPLAHSPAMPGYMRLECRLYPVQFLHRVYPVRSHSECPE